MVAETVVLVGYGNSLNDWNRWGLLLLLRQLLVSVAKRPNATFTFLALALFSRVDLPEEEVVDEQVQHTHLSRV